MSASFPGGGMLDASGEREREDFEVDEEWIERRLERRGSFGDIGGAMDTGECAIRRREGRRKGRGGGGRRSWCTCWCGQSGLSVLCPPLSSILYRRVNFRLSALVHLGTTFNTTQTLTTINSLPYPPQSSPVQRCSDSYTPVTQCYNSLSLSVSLISHSVLVRFSPSKLCYHHITILYRPVLPVYLLDIPLSIMPCSCHLPSY